VEKRGRLKDEKSIGYWYIRLLVYKVMRKSAPIKIVKCNKCGILFECKDTKRNNKREYCSNHCAVVMNGKNNKNKKHTEEWKRKISENLVE
jgi:transcription elongation factor Elf1